MKHWETFIWVVYWSGHLECFSSRIISTFIFPASSHWKLLLWNHIWDCKPLNNIFKHCLHLQCKNLLIIIPLLVFCIQNRRHKYCEIHWNYEKQKSCWPLNNYCTFIDISSEWKFSKIILIITSYFWCLTFLKRHRFRTNF